ncbi:hypothetical protein [Spirosoma gilvum]
MANPFYKTVTGKAALTGVIPTTIISCIAIGIQIYLTNKQFDLNTQKDRSDSIRTAQKEREDSIREESRFQTNLILADKQNEILKLQLEFEKRKSKEEIDLNKRLEGVSKRQLAISESQFNNQLQNVNNKSLYDLMRFSLSMQDIYDLLFLNHDDLDTWSGNVAWSKKVRKVLSNQLDNPVLYKNKKLFDMWVKESESLHATNFFYEVVVPYEKKDTIKKKIENEVKNGPGMSLSYQTVKILYDSCSVYYSRELNKIYHKN